MDEADEAETEDIHRDARLQGDRLWKVTLYPMLSYGLRRLLAV